MNVVNSHDSVWLLSQGLCDGNVMCLTGLLLHCVILYSLIFMPWNPKHLVLIDTLNVAAV